MVGTPLQPRKHHEPHPSLFRRKPRTFHSIRLLDLCMGSIGLHWKHVFLYQVQTRFSRTPVSLLFKWRWNGSSLFDASSSCVDNTWTERHPSIHLSGPFIHAVPWFLHRTLQDLLFFTWIQASMQTTVRTLGFLLLPSGPRPHAVPGLDFGL